MFCRFCGAGVPDDSRFCPKCGKALHREPNATVAWLARTFYLKTPYPYFGLLLVGFVSWVFWPKGPAARYDEIQWTIEQERKLEVRDENLFRQSYALVLENKGSLEQKDIPIELSATLVPPGRGDVLAEFLGRKLYILRNGAPLPLVVVLSDVLKPGEKRRYYFEGSIYSVPPFKVTYAVKDDEGRRVLANYEHEVQ